MLLYIFATTDNEKRMFQIDIVVFYFSLVQILDKGNSSIFVFFGSWWFQNIYINIYKFSACLSVRLSVRPSSEYVAKLQAIYILEAYT